MKNNLLLLKDNEILYLKNYVMMCEYDVKLARNYVLDI